MRLVALAAVAAVLLTGCAGGPDPEKGRFEGRAPLESCGELSLAEGETVPADAWDCLEAGVETGAEFVVAVPADGAVTRYYFRTSPEIAGVEMFIDATEEKWGTGKWDTRTCTGEDFDTIVAGCLAIFVPVEG